MTSNIRHQVVLKAAERNSVSVPITDTQLKECSTSKDFGINVFGISEMSKALPKPILRSFLQQQRGAFRIEKTTADAIAHAVKVWAIGLGATHFTHWFQPQNDSTAEKHDSFLTLKANPLNCEDTVAIDTFSGSQLLQSEPDASSFPSGGMRTTFEARGYTIWDTISPMFIKRSTKGTCVLYVPSIYISYNGDALDQKTLLLRSCESVNKATCRLLDLIDPAPAGSPPFVKKVVATLGTEQEFFLIDQGLYKLRKDLVITGRTLIGSLPPKHQQLEDHYFASIPSRVLTTINEAEEELCKLGVPMKTRHNEVAPAQYEVAPIFENAIIAVDHNLLTMDVLFRAAKRNNLEVLFHEKPFETINGSGKHCNWSLSTDNGQNLLDPTARPEKNYRFLLVLVAVLDAVLKNSGLLRATIASASNDHRLGASEAPPGILSVFLGSHLTEVLNSIEETRDVRSFSIPELKTIKVGGTVLDVKISALPNIERDLTDRNRTSPFAFTGNKFEFRAVGSKQSPSFPVAVLNNAVAASLREITQKLLDLKGNKEFPSDQDQLSVIREYITKTKSIRFEGDNYSQEWEEEAQKRGLLNIKTSPEAFKQLLKPEYKSLLTDQEFGIFSESELNARYHIMAEKYSKDIIVEAKTIRDIARQQVLPAVFEYKRKLAETIKSIEPHGCNPEAEKHALQVLTDSCNCLSKLVNELEDQISNASNMEDAEKQADECCKVIIPSMQNIRKHADNLEAMTSDSEWPLPKYYEILFH